MTMKADAEMLRGIELLTQRIQQRDETIAMLLEAAETALKSTVEDAYTRGWYQKLQAAVVKAREQARKETSDGYSS